MGIQAFRLDKNLVRIPVGKAHDLIFNRRAITRPDAFDNPRIQRRPIQAGADDVVGFTVGAGDMTRNLPGMMLRLADKRKHRHRVITVLLFQLAKIDGPTVDTRRRAGF